MVLCSFVRSFVFRSFVFRSFVRSCSGTQHSEFGTWSATFLKSEKSQFCISSWSVCRQSSVESCWQNKSYSSSLLFLHVTFCLCNLSRVDTLVFSRKKSVYALLLNLNLSRVHSLVFSRNKCTKQVRLCWTHLSLHLTNILQIPDHILNHGVHRKSGEED